MSVTLNPIMNTGTNNSPVTRPSQILLAAWVAAEKALPPDSLKLIEAHDALFAQWREAGWPSPIPAALKAASTAVEADPLAGIALELRQRSNTANAEELYGGTK